jgi:hypothetical protein
VTELESPGAAGGFGLDTGRWWSLRTTRLDRYARQINLRRLGGEGTARLLAAEVVVVRRRRDRSPAIHTSPRRAWAADDYRRTDRIECPTFNAKTLYGTADIGQSKAGGLSAPSRR